MIAIVLTPCPSTEHAEVLYPVDGACPLCAWKRENDRDEKQQGERRSVVPGGWTRAVRDAESTPEQRARRDRATARKRAQRARQGVA